MTRHLDVKHEEREAARVHSLYRALEFGIVGALEGQGIELLGLALKFNAFDCLLTVKAEVAGVRSVCFIGSDSIMNCFIKLESAALRHDLKWRADKYQQSDV